jgi:hypothetical protein
MLDLQMEISIQLLDMKDEYEKERKVSQEERARESKGRCLSRVNLTIDRSCSKLAFPVARAKK